MTKVPVIAITGYLGSGKTTLLNHLLRRPQARIGVVINDFGKLNVDAALVAGQVEEAASITGGCICCMPDGGGLDESLERLSAPELRLDSIIIEASGIADPLELARLLHYSTVDTIRSGGAIEVVDAVEQFSTVDIKPDPPNRYLVSSLVAITKVDLLPPDEREATIAQITDRIRQRNPEIPIVLASHGQIDPDLVFDVAAEEDPADQLPIAQLLRDDEPHNHQHVLTVSRELAEPVSPSALVRLLENPPAGAYRMKGRIPVLTESGMQGFVVNLVGRMIHVAELEEVPTSGEIVAIGLDLDTAAAKQCFADLGATPSECDEQSQKTLERYVRLSK